MLSECVSTSQDSVRERALVLLLNGRPVAVEAGSWRTDRFACSHLYSVVFVIWPFHAE